MMDFLRTISFFILLILHCHYHIVTAKLCGNSSDRSYSISQQDKKEVTGCTNEIKEVLLEEGKPGNKKDDHSHDNDHSHDTEDNTFIGTYLGAIIGGSLLFVMLAILIGVVAYLKYWRKNIYPQRKGKQNNTPDSEKARQEPTTVGAMNFGYEAGSSNRPQDDGRSKAKVSSTSTEFFLSNVEQAAFGGKDVPVIKISRDAFVDIPDQTKDTRTSDHGLNSYLKKFEQSEMVPRIIRESIKRSIKRFTSQKTKMENY